MKSLDNILKNSNQLLVENYFDLQTAAEKKYGKNTVVIIEIGSFFEIYQNEKMKSKSDYDLEYLYQLIHQK